SRSEEPETRIIGKQLVVALARAVRPLRKPGADTVRQTPGFFVRKPAMAAALPACCSCRNEMTRMPAACARRPRSVIGMPGTPKMVLMPLSVSASMTRCQLSVRFRSASAALASGVAAAVSNMVPSGAVAFWRSEWGTVFGSTGQSQHDARAFSWTCGCPYQKARTRGLGETFVAVESLRRYDGQGADLGCSCEAGVTYRPF